MRPANDNGLINTNMKYMLKKVRINYIQIYKISIVQIAISITDYTMFGEKYKHKLK